MGVIFISYKSKEPSSISLEGLNYSNLKASIGFNLEALLAGYIPNIKPTKTENKNDPSTTLFEMTIVVEKICFPI